MFRVFLAVVQDLAQFVVEPFIRPTRDSKVVKLALPPRENLISLNTPKAVVDELSVATALTETLIQTTASISGQTGYCLVQPTALHKRPVWTFDGVLKFLPLGKSVQILGFEGRFVHVLVDEGYGWILKDEVSDSKDAIWPRLISNTTYLAGATETKKIRTLLDDEFFTQELYLPLQDVELVTYRLSERGLHISWNEHRPRPAGLWHELLRGKSGVHVGLEPKTGSVMEIFPVEGESRLLYVSAVHPDESIMAEAIGIKEEGCYEDLSLSKEVWKQWRPVFIQVS